MAGGDYTSSSQLDALPVANARSIARYFRVLADPTRVRLVKLLGEGEWCVSELTGALEMDQPAISHQLKYLRESGLVHWTKSGRHVYYTLADRQLHTILLGCIRNFETEQAKV